MTDAVDAHWLPIDGYLTALDRETRRFRECLGAAESGTRVPTCPDWDVDDLLWHLGGEVQAFWSRVVAHRPEAPDGWAEPVRPAGRAALLEALDGAHEDLLRGLRSADADDAAWSWAEDPRLHTVGFTMRRQAHEALIHRVDAELAVGERTPLDPDLATDGMVECLDWMYGEHPAWGHFEDDGARAVVEATDTGRRVLVGLGRLTGQDPEDGEDVDEDDLRVLDPALRGAGPEPHVRVAGTAEQVDLWLWGRGPVDALAVTGDEAVRDRLMTLLGQPID